MAAARVCGTCSRALIAAAKDGAASSVTTTLKMPAPKRISTLQKKISVSPLLGKSLSASEASCTDAVKEVWEHIKLHNLQVYKVPATDVEALKLPLLGLFEK